jgi:hypothetical protein
MVFRRCESGSEGAVAIAAEASSAEPPLVSGARAYGGEMPTAFRKPGRLPPMRPEVAPPQR